MINEENLNKIYNGIINGEDLTTKVLNSYGFNSKEITNLISDGIIERVKRGYYQFLDVDKLLFYGKILISKKEYDRANICFQKCHELNPQHSGAAFQLFIRAIQNKNYKDALEYFEITYQTDNEFYIQDSNYYLYLLSNIVELPEKYREFTKYLKIEDIEVKNNDKRYSNREQQNNIRSLSLNQSFNIALNRLNNLIRKQGKTSVQEFLIRILLTQAKEKHYEIKMKMLSLVKDKKYDALLELLNKITIYRHLSYVEELMYGLLNDLYRIKGSKKLPDRKEIITDSFTIALQNRNYELAYQIAKNHNNQSNPVYYLLCDIIDEIENINKQYQSVKMNTAEVLETTSKEYTKPKQEEILSKDDKEQENIDIKKVTFADIITSLMQNNFANAITYLRNYLINIGKREYEFLIIDLIKIALLEHDLAYTKAMIVLNDISKDNFTYNISEYLQYFYGCLATNDFQKAEIYLDIISKSKSIGQEFVLISALEEILVKSKNIANYKANNEVFEIIDQAIKISDGKTKSVVPKKEKLATTEKPILTSLNETIYDEEYINSKRNELIKNGVVILEPMNDARIERINEIINKYPDIVSFIIAPENKKRIVLRYKPIIQEYVDVKLLLAETKTLYQMREYEACVSTYKELLEFFPQPKAFIYANMGIALMKCRKKDIAIKYFIIAEEVSKNEEHHYDFADLIAKLSGKINLEDIKPYVKMKISDFTNEYSYYGIDQIEEIIMQISSGIPVEVVISQHELTYEQALLVNLIYARECYTNEDYTTGDLYMQKVEKSKEKSNTVKKILNEIRKNKRFYKNRRENNINQESLLKL